MTVQFVQTAALGNPAAEHERQSLAHQAPLPNGTGTSVKEKSGANVIQSRVDQTHHMRGFS
jgi:hypothetical protein